MNYLFFILNNLSILINACRFLHSIGVPASKWGRMLTVNPFLLQEDLDTLKIRVQYLTSKNYSTEAIAHIVASYPKWLSKRLLFT